MLLFLAMLPQPTKEIRETDKPSWEYIGEIPANDWIGEAYKITDENSQLAVAYHSVNGDMRIEFIGQIAEKIDLISIRPEQCVFANSTPSIFFNTFCSAITIENSLLQHSDMWQGKYLNEEDEDLVFVTIQFSDVLNEIKKILNLSVSPHQALYKVFYLAHELKIQKLIKTFSNSKTRIWGWDRVACGDLLEIPNLNFAIQLFNNNINQLSTEYQNWFKQIFNFYLNFTEVMKKYFKYPSQYDTSTTIKISAFIFKHKCLNLIFSPEEKIKLFQLAIIAYGESIKGWDAWKKLPEQQQQEIVDFFEKKFTDFQFTDVTDITNHFKQLATNKNLTQLRNISYKIFGGTTELHPSAERAKLYDLLYPKSNENPELSKEHFTELAKAFEVYYQQQRQYYRGNGFRENMPLPKYIAIHFNDAEQWTGPFNNFSTKTEELIYITHGGGWHHIQQFIDGNTSGYLLEKGGYGIQVTPITGADYPKRACLYANRKYIDSQNYHTNMDSPAILFATIQIKYLTAANNRYEAGLKPENACYLKKIIVIDLNSLQAIAYDNGNKTHYNDAMACLEFLGKDFKEAFRSYQDDVYSQLQSQRIIEYFSNTQSISTRLNTFGIYNPEKDKENPKQELPIEESKTNSLNAQSQI